VHAQWTPQVAFSNVPGTFEGRNTSGVFTIPVHKKWTAGVKLDTTSRSPKELLTNSLCVRATEVMLNARFGSRELRSNDDPRLLHTVPVGL